MATDEQMQNKVSVLVSYVYSIYISWCGIIITIIGPCYMCDLINIIWECHECVE